MTKINKDTIGGLSEQSGSAKLIAKLQVIFSIYADDLETFINGGVEYELLHNTVMFDMVVKLLNVSDKIKKLDMVDPDGEEPKEKSIKNIQDFTLNKIK